MVPQILKYEGLQPEGVVHLPFSPAAMFFNFVFLVQGGSLLQPGKQAFHVGDRKPVPQAVTAVTQGILGGCAEEAKCCSQDQVFHDPICRIACLLSVSCMSPSSRSPPFTFYRCYFTDPLYRSHLFPKCFIFLRYAGCLLTVPLSTVLSAFYNYILFFSMTQSIKNVLSSFL